MPTTTAVAFSAPLTSVASTLQSLTKQVLLRALPSGQSTTKARMLPPGAPCASFATIVQPASVVSRLKQPVALESNWSDHRWREGVPWG